MTSSTRDVERRSVVAFMGRTIKQGKAFAQPVTSIREIGDKRYVVLSDSSGALLDIYRVRQDGQLKRLVRWPKEFNQVVA